MSFKLKVYAMMIAILFSGRSSAQLESNKITDDLYKQAKARGYQSFNEACNATTGKAWNNIKLKTVFADITRENDGFYITADGGTIWRVEQAQHYPNSYLTDEMRSLAKAAVLSGVNINICGTEKTTPATVWIIELAPW